MELSAQGHRGLLSQALVARLAKARLVRRVIRFAEIAQASLRAQPGVRYADLLALSFNRAHAAEVMQPRDVLSKGPGAIARGASRAASAASGSSPW